MTRVVSVVFVLSVVRTSSGRTTNALSVCWACVWLLAEGALNAVCHLPEMTSFSRVVLRRKDFIIAASVDACNELPVKQPNNHLSDPKLVQNCC